MLGAKKAGQGEICKNGNVKNLETGERTKIPCYHRKKTGCACPIQRFQIFRNGNGDCSSYTT